MWALGLLWVLGAAAVLAPAAVLPSLRAAEPPSYGAELESFQYPHPVKTFALQSQQQSLHMAYLDVAPSGKANGRTAVLLHGKNFCAASWAGTIDALSAAGFRVIAPDQIGFCKSSKPRGYQFTFQQLVRDTQRLLERAGVSRFVLIGHSMGGMLAMRYGLMHPRSIEKLVLVNPIGLEDWKAKGVPHQSVDAWYQAELQTTAERIRSDQKATYYAGTWKPEYDVWVEMLAGMYRGPGKQAVAWSSALTYDMIYTQPVVYELEKLEVPVLLLIGKQDNTAIGKALAPEAVRKTLGVYAQLAPAAAARLPHARLVMFDDLGHSPQIQAPARFHRALLEGLAR